MYKAWSVHPITTSLPLAAEQVVGRSLKPTTEPTHVIKVVRGQELESFFSLKLEELLCKLATATGIT
jgi:hypothetical protein